MSPPQRTGSQAHVVEVDGKPRVQEGGLVGQWLFDVLYAVVLRLLVNPFIVNARTVVANIILSKLHFPCF